MKISWVIGLPVASISTAVKVCPQSLTLYVPVLGSSLFGVHVKVPSGQLAIEPVIEFSLSLCLVATLVPSELKHNLGSTGISAIPINSVLGEHTISPSPHISIFCPIKVT